MVWFGASKTKREAKAAAADPMVAVERIRTAIESQEKRESHVNQKMRDIAVQAKARLGAGDKKGAINLMKKKKMYEREAEKIENVKMTLETQVMNLESAACNANVFQTMSVATKTMKKIRKDVGIDNVDDVMEEMRDEMDMGNEISQAIGQQVDLYGEDEDDLMNELNELADLEADEEAAKMPSVPQSRMSKPERTQATGGKKMAMLGF